MRRLGLPGALLLLGSAASAAAPKTAPKGKIVPKAKTAAPAPADGVTINGVTYSDKGTVTAPIGASDPLPAEQALRLKKVFLFPSMDDVSGALAPKLDEKLADLFNHNTRFETIRDPQVVKALSPDESSYYKAALSPDVHKEAAKVTGADTTVLLRTRNVGPDTRMTLELRDAHGGLLFAEEGSVRGSAKMEERWAQIEKLYRGILTRLPFEGTVTGRTAATVTVDLGTGSMKPNEIVELARIVSLQRHPLLGTVVGTDYVRTGRARVTSVDRVLSFAEVIEEFPGEKVSPGQKVLRQQANLVHRGDSAEAPPPGPAKRRPVKDLEGAPGDAEEPRAKKEESPLDDRLKGEFDHPKPRYGQIGANLYYGSLTHDQTQTGNETSFGGSGVGADIGGELWITKNWIFAGELGFQNANVKGTTGSSALIGSTPWGELEIYGGYRIYPDAIGEGVVVTGGLGYEMMKFGYPATASPPLGLKKYSGLELRADGDIHFLQNQMISAGFSIAPMAGVSEVGPSLGTSTGATLVGLHLSWGRELGESLWLRLGVKYDVASASYDISGSSISDKRFAIGPGLYYLF